MGGKNRILIVDDEKHIVELLIMNCKQYGYDYCVAGDGMEAIEMAISVNPDIVLLDLMLPGMGGLEVCRNLKQDKHTRHIPVIMLTAKSEESDKVIGLGIGADDYITKPFSIRELFARIDAALRRTREYVHNDAKQAGAANVSVDVEGHEIRIGPDTVNLSPVEFLLFTELAAQSGKLVSRDNLIARAGITGTADPGRSLDVHIRNIRKKIAEQAGAGISIRTIRGFGYKLSESAK